MESLLRQLVQRGFDTELALSALKLSKMDFEKAFDWLKAHSDDADVKPQTAVTDSLLISFEDDDIRQRSDSAPYIDGSKVIFILFLFHFYKLKKKKKEKKKNNNNNNYNS
jgi:hypothetical protein